LDVYQDYLRLRWDGGGRDVTLLWKELQQKGYVGQRKSVAKYLQRFRLHSPFRSTSQLAWLFMKDVEGLQEEERNHLDSLLISTKSCRRSTCWCNPSGSCLSSDLCRNWMIY